MKYLIFLLLLSLQALAGQDGGWVSSGGELFKDAHNPWFVRNTKQVYYCILSDEQTLSQTADTLPKVIAEALDFWKKEFSKVVSQETPGRFDLGGQDFIQVDCKDEKVDVRFLFGYSTLTAEEIKYLVKPEKYIGVSVRTAYDKVNLKAKGFVYIASDKGEHSYENNGTLTQEAWRNKKLLQYALMHELGHVFGFPHTGSGLMSEVFLDQLLNKFLVDSFLKLPIDSFLMPHNELENCFVNTKVRMQILKLKLDETCVKAIAAPTGGYTLEANPGKRIIGKMMGLIPEVFDMRDMPASVLQLSPEQKVFTAQETAFRSFMYGPTIIDQGFKGTLFINEGNTAYPIYLKVTGNSVAFYGKLDNSISPYVIFSSPLSLLLLKDPTP